MDVPPIPVDVFCGIVVVFILVGLVVLGGLKIKFGVIGYRKSNFQEYEISRNNHISGRAKKG